MSKPSQKFLSSIRSIFTFITGSCLNKLLDFDNFTLTREASYPEPHRRVEMFSLQIVAPNLSPKLIQKLYRDQNRLKSILASISK